MSTAREHAILYALAVEAYVGPKAVMALLVHFGTPAAIWRSRPAELSSVVRLGEESMERIEKAHDEVDRIEADLLGIDESGVQILSLLDEEYPARLRRLDDPPTLLFSRGRWPSPETRAVAVVGTHQADEEGIADAVAWGKGLAERGVTVVSGLARGIDGGGHTGALAGGGATVAVLGSGIDNIYPPEHRGLAAEIIRDGTLVSEYPPNAALTKPRLVYRNRIIAGLSDALVVVRLHEDTRGSMEVIRRARDIALPVYLVATDAGKPAQQAVADGAIPIGRLPDFDLVLNYM